MALELKVRRQLVARAAIESLMHLLHTLAVAGWFKRRPAQPVGR